MPGVSQGDSYATLTGPRVHSGSLAQGKPAAMPGGIESIANEIGKHLAQLTRVASERRGVLITAIDYDPGSSEPALIKNQDGI